MRQVALSGGTIAYEERGTGTPVIVLHGAGLDHRHMLDAVEPVFEGLEGWRRLYLDLPGHGHSRADDDVSTQDEVLGLIHEAVESLRGTDPAAVIGESRGATHALGLARRWPGAVSGLMAVVAGGWTDESVLPEHRTFETADLRALEPEVAARAGRLVLQRPGIIEKVRRSKVPATRLVDKRLAHRLEGRLGYSFPLSDPETPFPGPCLFINGRQDGMAGYDDAYGILEGYPRASFAILDRAGHSVAWEQPELFLALARNWLDRVRSG